mgnify:CR=1 FL=1
MIIVHGQTQKTRSLGAAAAPCVNCRCVRPHIIEETRQHQTLYFVPVGTGKPLKMEARCSVCGRRYRADPAEFLMFVPPEDAAEASIERLAECTNPDAAAELVRLLSLDERAAAGELLPEDRIDMVVNAVFGVEGRLHKRLGRTHLDALSGGLLLLTLTLIVGGLILIAHPDPAVNMFGCALIVAAAPAAAAMIWALGTDVRRQVRRKHWYPLVFELQQYMPGTDEIEFAFERLERMHVRCIEHLPWRRLADEVWADAEPAAG